MKIRERYQIWPMTLAQASRYPMKVIIMMGFPGSGKSHYAKSLPGNNRIVSSDHYFTDVDGNYNWTIKEAHKGHEDCMRRFIEWARNTWFNNIDCIDNIIVDNTNVRVFDSAPYIIIAKAYGFDVEVKYLDTDITVAKSRNVHNVPDVAYERMQKNFEFLLQNWPKDFPDIEYVKT